jgi:hypothetical protein
MPAADRGMARASQFFRFGFLVALGGQSWGCAGRWTQEPSAPRAGPAVVPSGAQRAGTVAVSPVWWACSAPPVPTAAFRAPAGFTRGPAEPKRGPGGIVVEVPF